MLKDNKPIYYNAVVVEERPGFEIVHEAKQIVQCVEFLESDMHVHYEEQITFHTTNTGIYSLTSTAILDETIIVNTLPSLRGPMNVIRDFLKEYPHAKLIHTTNDGVLLATKLYAFTLASQ